MAVTVFKDSSYNLTGLLERIERGEIGLPDIQRPFVWSNAQVRDLFDSMYKGFPVGYLLFWSTGADVTSRQIGVDAKQTVPDLLVVDGQQRLTSLFAVMCGQAVLRKDYSEARIRVAFRPDDAKFEVTDAAVENDPEFIPDISVVFEGSFHSFTRQYLRRIEEYRGGKLGDEEENRLVDAIDRLKDLQNYPFQAIELDRSISEEDVADVFVRINSKGKQLNKSDFILTLMSVFREKERRELEAFARAAKVPTTGPSSPFNHFIEPSPDQLLRTSVGLAFRRARLQYVYSILRGKDLETGEFSGERREQQFGLLEEAQAATLDLGNWHEFLKCLQRAGFRSSRMISSETALMYCYTIWLIGRRDYGVALQPLREVISRWWFMAHTTGRYTGSSETQLEADLNRLRDIPTGDAKGFCDLLDRLIGDTFTNDYWAITLPNRLDTAAAKSPPLAAYWAALNLLDAEMLFSELKVSAMLDPVVTPIKDMERHHLFPRAHLARGGITERSRVNAIANMAFVDWSDNIAISDRDPAEYWSEATARTNAERIERQRFWHALPVGWEQLDYDEFCEKRRKLIAAVTHQGFNLLFGQADSSTDPGTALPELISRGESAALEFKERARWSHGTDKRGLAEHIVAKTISGFMNAEGGTLLIGVNDEGKATGIEEDYETLSKANRDGFELFLVQLIADHITGPSPSLCRISFHEVDGRDVCRIDVGASAKPVFTRARNSKDHTDFWVRLGNRTDQYYGSEQADYLVDHWG